MDTSVLEDIGLTNAEIKVYLALLGSPNTTAGPIIEKTNLQNSVVHITLHKLLEKGLATYIKKGNVKHYSATNPESILKFIDEKRNKLQEILPQLIAKQKPMEKQEAEIYTGFKGFKAMLEEFIKGGKKGDEYLVFAFYTSNPDDYNQIYNYYNEFDKERARRGFAVKVLSPQNIKDKFIGRTIKNITFVDYAIPLNVSVFNNKVILTPYEDEKVCFLINSRQLANQYRTLFYAIWDKENRNPKN